MTQILNSSNVAHTVTYETWMAAIASSACIGFTSLLPWLFNLTFFEKDQELSRLKGGQDGNGRMKYLLSFAVGAILGDIFFHLIPESYQSHLLEFGDSEEIAHKKVGISIIAGIFMFIIVEIMLNSWSENLTPDDEIAVLLKKTATEKQVISLKASGNKQAIFNQIDVAIPIFSNAKVDLRKQLANMSSRRTSIGGIAVNNNNNEIFEDILDNNNSSNMMDLNASAKTNRNEFSQMNDTKCSIPKGVAANGYIMRKRKSDTVKPSINVISPVFALKHDLIANATGPIVAVNSAGYLNLIANGFDNFTHGLAIGASFMIGSKVGLLTTFVIIIHEIPHEICDYAILVNSGFSRWDAVKAQSSVSLFGIIGTATALYVKSVETLYAKTVWILPFSAGGFLYIALVNLLPEILDKKTDLRNTLGQVTCVILGILFMATVAIF